MFYRVEYYNKSIMSNEIVLYVYASFLFKKLNKNINYIIEILLILIIAVYYIFIIYVCTKYFINNKQTNIFGDKYCVFRRKK